MTPLRLNLIGCGAAAQGLYKAPLRRLERSRVLSVVSVVDQSLDRAEGLARAFRQARPTSNLDEALEESAADLSLVLTPAALHLPHTLQALGSDHHVLCEKPMATTEDECRQMVEAAESRNLTLAVGMLRRFFPSVAFVKSFIDAGELGELIGFEYREGGKFEWPVATVASFQRREQGVSGGVLLDLGPHTLDLVGHLLGSLTLQSYREDALGGVESNAWLDLEAQGKPGRMQLSWTDPLPNELRIRGSRAEVVMRLDRFDRLAIDQGDGFREIQATDSFPVDLEISGGKRLVPRFYTDAVLCQIVQMIRALSLGEAPAVTGRECRDHVALIEQCYNEAQPMERSWMPAEEDRMARRLHWRSAS